MSSFGSVSLLWGKVTMGCQKVESWCVYIIPTATIQWWIFMPNPGICFRYISIPTIAQSKALNRTNIIILCSKYWVQWSAGVLKNRNNLFLCLFVFVASCAFALQRVTYLHIWVMFHIYPLKHGSIPPTNPKVLGPALNPQSNLTSNLTLTHRNIYEGNPSHLLLIARTVKTALFTRG